MKGYTTTLMELNKKLNPVITDREVNESDFMKEEVYVALLEIVKREAYRMVDITNDIEI